MRSKTEIYEVCEWAMKGIEDGTRYPGMSYEEGVKAALDWVTEDTDERPDAE